MKTPLYTHTCAKRGYSSPDSVAADIVKRKLRGEDLKNAIADAIAAAYEEGRRFESEQERLRDEFRPRPKRGPFLKQLIP